MSAAAPVLRGISSMATRQVLAGLTAAYEAVSYTHLTLPTIYSV